MQIEFRAIVQSEYGPPEKVLRIANRRVESEELGADDVLIKVIARPILHGDIYILSVSKQGPAPAGAAAVRPPDGNGFLWIDQDGFAKAFAADADPVEARVMAAVQKPLSINSFIAKSGPPAWKHLPSWCMVATEDQMIPRQAEEFRAS